MLLLLAIIVSNNNSFASFVVCVSGKGCYHGTGTCAAFSSSLGSFTTSHVGPWGCAEYNVKPTYTYYSNRTATVNHNGKEEAIMSDVLSNFFTKMLELSQSGNLTERLFVQEYNKVKKKDTGEVSMERLKAIAAEENGVIKIDEPSESLNLSPGKVKTGATADGARKGWDGTVKGVNVMIMPSAEGITVLFPDDIAFEVNETEKIIKVPGRSKGGATASGSKGLPVKGAIVKGGRNPGPNTKVISSIAPNTYAIPEEWTEDGEYVLQIIYETADKSKLLSEFVLSKKGANYQVAKGAGSPKAAGF